MDKKKELQGLLSKYFDLIDPNRKSHIEHLVSASGANLIPYLEVSDKKTTMPNVEQFLRHAYNHLQESGFVNNDFANERHKELDRLSDGSPTRIELTDDHKNKIKDVLSSNTQSHLLTNTLRGGYLSPDAFRSLFDNDQQRDSFMDNLLLPALNTPSDQHDILWHAEDRLLDQPEDRVREQVLHHLSRMVEKYPNAKLNIPIDYVDKIPNSSQALYLFNHPNVQLSINRRITRPEDVATLLGTAEAKFHNHPKVMDRFVNHLKEKVMQDVGNNSAASTMLQHLDELVNKDYSIPQYGGSTKAIMADTYLKDVGRYGSKELFNQKLNEILDKNDPELAKYSLNPLLTSGGSYLNYDPKTDERLLSLFDKINQTSMYFHSPQNMGLAKVYDAIWAKTHNSKHQEAARFWNEYEEDVGNHHFPIAHAAMTGQHQKHRPYRTDKEGGDQEWVDSKGSEKLWEGIRHHGKVAQAAVLDLIHDDKMRHLFRKNSKGDIYVKVMRGVGGKYGKIVSANHQLGGKVPVAPIQSWTLDPGTAMTFATNNRSVGGDQSRIVMHAWLPLKNLVHYGKMVSHSFKPTHAGETELIFHHPESMIGLEKIHDMDVQEQRDELNKQHHNTVLPETTFKDIKDIAHRLKDDEYWKSMSSGVRLKRHTEVRRTSKDPRYWADKFDALSFDSPEHAQHYMKWAMGLRKGVDHEQMSAHFDVVPDGSGKFKLAIKPESHAALDAKDKAILDKKAKKGLNSHLINSPKYWIDRLAAGKSRSIFGHDPEAAKYLLEAVVKEFNDKNLQNITPEHVMQFIETRPNPVQFMSHVSDEVREKTKGTVEFFPKDKYQRRQDNHLKLWIKMKASAPVDKQTIDQEMKMGAISPNLPDYAIMEAGKKNFLNAIVKHTGQEKDLEQIKQNLDQHFHKFYKPRKVKISGPVEANHVVFDPVDPLEKK